ncbi:MAG: methyltransferase domain-containing protein, partial [Alphaproteobacteria bacterium]|nr:methyltransferase domain-containing protein [Alphaproteobacteria bacterium]
MNPVREFYQDAQREWDRLDLPLCRIEFASTLALIDQYFTEGMAVLDVGGGPGRYTIELITRGCKVTLLDLSPENIALAKAKISEIGLSAEGLLVGDARDLSNVTDRCFDGILALGPLYHLYERQERIGFLKAARARLSAGGILIAAYLNAWGRTLLADAPGCFRDRQKLDRLLSGGKFVGTDACPGFTECHWCTPDEAQEELCDAGFDILDEIGAEGFAGGMRNEIAAIANGDRAAFDQIV